MVTIYYQQVTFVSLSCFKPGYEGAVSVARELGVIEVTDRKQLASLLLKGIILEQMRLS